MIQFWSDKKYWLFIRYTHHVIYLYDYFDGSLRNISDLRRNFRNLGSFLGLSQFNVHVYSKKIKLKIKIKINESLI